MKNRNKLVFIISLIAAACFGATLHKVPKIPATAQKKQNTITKAKTTKHTAAQEIARIEAELAQREKVAWQKLTNATGISKQDVLAHKRKRKDPYRRGALRSQRERITFNPPLSAQIVKDAQAICKDHGINPSAVTFAPLKSQSTAACTNDYTVFIDEERLSVYPKKAKQFVFAHELSHFRNEDSSFMVAMKELLGTRAQSLQYQLFKLQESRADLLALSLGKQYADAGITYGSYLVERDGQSYDGGGQHPAPTARLEMAQRVAKCYA